MRNLKVNTLFPPPDVSVSVSVTSSLSSLEKLDFVMPNVIIGSSPVSVELTWIQEEAESPASAVSLLAS